MRYSKGVSFVRGVRASAAGVQQQSQSAIDEEFTWTEEPQQLIVLDDFLPSAASLRSHYDSRFRNPLKTTGDRFVWDYWHVPNQYTLLRTPADQFFPEDTYRELEDALLEYGEQHLGCRGISPIWLSYYVDGCRQELHADSPHGPWAFVLSLTNWDGRSFSGGETMIFQPHMLDFWSSFDPSKGFELKDMVTLVEPRFNRLTVFDGRYPHGVRPVEGTRDPLRARLVLHGWFTEPSPFFDGPLDEEAATQALHSMLSELYEELGSLPQCLGTVVVRFTVSGETGQTSNLRCLTDTLVHVPSDPDPDGENVRDQVFGAIVHYLSQRAAFPPCQKGNTVITLPFIFQ
ncbi:g2199 [Coccomyxa elongata]